MKKLLATPARKLMLSLAVVGTAAAVAGLGTFATFTSSTPAAAPTVDSGTVAIALGASGTSANRLDVNASGIVPGDTMQRSVAVANTGNQDLSSVTLTVSASPSSLLDTDTASGLQLSVDRCSLPWLESGSGPAYTYTCAGATSTVVSSRPVVGSNVALTNLSATTAGNTDHLRVTLSLPSTAGNDLQGLSSTLHFVFTGTQRAAASK